MVIWKDIYFFTNPHLSGYILHLFGYAVHESVVSLIVYVDTFVDVVVCSLSQLKIRLV